MRNVENITPVLLTSTKIEVAEPLCPEPLDSPLPFEPLSQAIPGDLGGEPIAAVAP
jgi:hypothetical protein